jgi:hypothetical protein
MIRRIAFQRKVSAFRENTELVTRQERIDDFIHEGMPRTDQPKTTKFKLRHCRGLIGLHSDGRRAGPRNPRVSSLSA